MKYVTIISLALLSFSSFAQNLSAHATMLDNAEARVVMQAKEAGASYRVDSARYVNHIETPAELIR